MIRSLVNVTTGRRSRWAVLVAWLALMAVAAPLTMKLNAEKVDQTTSLLPANSVSAEVTKTLAKRFKGGSGRPAILLYHRSGGLTEADKARIARDASEAAKVPLAGTPIPAFVLVPDDAGPAPQPGQVAPDGATAFTVVPLDSGKALQVAHSIDALRALEGSPAPGLEYHVTGSPALLNDINTAVEAADIVLVLATVLFVLALLLAIYRSPILAFVPLFVVTVSFLVSSAIIYLLARQGLEVDSTSTSLLAVLIFGAGTDYCLLLVSRYRDDLRQTEDAGDALRGALPLAVPAIMASGFTVAAALLTLLASQLGTNKTLAPVCAIGVVVILVASVTLLPALLSLLGRRGFWPSATQAAYDPERYAPPKPIKGAPKPTAEEEFVGQASSVARGRLGLWTQVGLRVLGRPLPALVAGIALLSIGALGLLTYHPDVNPVKEFRTSPDSKAGYDLFRAKFPPGALGPATVLIERSGGPVMDTDIFAVAQRIAKFPHIAALLPGPEPRSIDGRIARLELVFDDDPFQRPAIERIGKIRAAVAHPGFDVTVTIGDGPARFRDYHDAANSDLLVLAPLVLVVIFLVLVILLRSVVAPLFLLATVVVSYLGTLGIAMLIFDVVFGRAGIDPLLPILSFIFLVALGVDYNIFLMTRIREEATRHGTRAGVLRGLVKTGPVITSAGIILAGTFLVLATLPVWLLFELGFTVALGVLIDAFIVRTVVVPAITVMLGDRAWLPSKLSGAPRRPTAGTEPS
ncbi:MAG: putative drug exporter of the superfamily [Solirubrobacteraceae bacterium]|nr:putative drug exporter of the superfamily [Solirubrobacteraceae bacterium]